MREKSGWRGGEKRERSVWRGRIIGVGEGEGRDDTLEREERRSGWRGGEREQVKGREETIH